MKSSVDWTPRENNNNGLKQPMSIANHPYLKLVKPHQPNNESSNSFPPGPSTRQPTSSSSGHNQNHHKARVVPKDSAQRGPQSTPSAVISPTALKHPLPQSNLTNYSPQAPLINHPILKQAHSLPPSTSASHPSYSHVIDTDTLTNDTNHAANTHTPTSHYSAPVQDNSLLHNEKDGLSLESTLPPPSSSSHFSHHNNNNNNNNNNSSNPIVPIHAITANRSDSYDIRDDHSLPTVTVPHLGVHFNFEDEAQDTPTELPLTPVRRSTFTTSSGTSVQKLPLGGVKSGSNNSTPTPSPQLTPILSVMSPPPSLGQMDRLSLRNDDDDDLIGGGDGVPQAFTRAMEKHQELDEPSSPPSASHNLNLGYNSNATPLSPYGSQPRGSFSFGRHSFYSMQHDDHDDDEDAESTDCFTDAYSVRGCGDDDELE